MVIYFESALKYLDVMNNTWIQSFVESVVWMRLTRLGLVQILDPVPSKDQINNGSIFFTCV